MTKIIGHRGAAGLALENSRQSIKAAIRYSVDAIEFDVHLTSDGKLVVMHDRTTRRVAGETVLLADKTLAELQALSLDNGQNIPSLDEMLDLVGDLPVFIDVKDHGSAEELLNALDRHPTARASVVSFRHHELYLLHEARPELPLFMLEHFSPLEIVQHARKLGAHGIGLNMWLMNPLTYYLTRRYNLEVYVYTVNSPFIARFFRLLYPKAALCTDHPDRLIQQPVVS